MDKFHKKKHIYHIKSTSDITTKRIITTNNPFKSNLSNSNKINNMPSLNLNSISNNNNKLIDNYNTNTNRTMIKKQFILEVIVMLVMYMEII